MSLPELAFTLDGEPLLIDGVRFSTVVDGGYAELTGHTPAENILRRSIGQGAPLVCYSAGEVRWAGRLVTDPHIHDGVAEINAVGEKVRAEKAKGRLLYMTRDVSLFQDARDEPFSIISSNEGGDKKFDVEVAESALKFHINKDDSFTSNDERGVVLWAPGTPGGITSVAFTVSARSDGLTRGRIRRFTGPSGAKTSVGTFSSADGTVVAQAISSAEDAITLAYEVTSTFTSGNHKRMVLNKLRARGIATTDTYRADEVAADVGGRLGFSTMEVETTSKNILPLDWEASDSWADLLDYMAALEDHLWLVLGTDLHFRPWGRTTWTTTHDGAEIDLQPLELYNIARVGYEGLNGAPRVAEVAASPDPLAGVGIDNVFGEDLSDPQADSTLADAVASLYAQEMSQKRWEGSVTVHSATNDRGNDDPRAILPGDYLRIADWGPAEATTHRIHEVRQDDNSVELGIEAPVSIEPLLRFVTSEAPAKRRKKRRRRRKK